MSVRSTNNIAIISYVVTFAFGVLGHSLSFITFCQIELRSTSTTVLLIGTTFSDLLFLLMSLYDFFLINLSIPQLSPHYVVLCRFRTFVMNFAQTSSSWLLTCVAFDRLIRARFPHRSRQWCRKRHAILAHLIIFIGSIALNCHVLLPAFRTRDGFTQFICGVTRDELNQYVIFYYYAWTAMAMTLNIIIPSILMFTCLGIMHRQVLHAAKVRANRQIQKHMLLLILSKILLFIFCTLPYGISRLVLTYSIDPTQIEQNENFILLTALCNILLNGNYSLAFYLHCLTSSLFREIFLRTIKRWFRCEGNAVEPAAPAMVSAGIN